MSDSNGYIIGNSIVTDDTCQASLWLQQGKILAYPTESVWGLGCDPFNQSAILRLLTLKNRPIHKGLIVLTANDKNVSAFLDNLPSTQIDKILTSWQDRLQATTWLFGLPVHLPVTIPSWLTGSHQSLAIRCIAHTQIAQICQNMDNPYKFVVSTSCNPNGKMPADSLHTAFDYFGNEVYYFAGQTLGFDKPSQIKDATTGQIIRL